MKTNLYVLSFIVLCLTACGNSHHNENLENINEAIIGGQETPKDHLASRYLALIYDKATDNYCTAMLIRKNILLTAGHCIKSSADQITVAFGNRPLAGDYVMRQADKVLVHPGYKNHNVNRNDLALVLIKDSAPAGYEPLAIPEETFVVEPGMMFTAAGYGRITGVTDPTGRDTQGSGFLRHVNLQIDGFSEDGTQFYVDQTNGKGICHGDSGGPAMMRFKGKDYAIGIASAISWLVPGELSDKAKKEYLEKQNVCAHKSIYISVKQYRDWINDSINNLLN